MHLSAWRADQTQTGTSERSRGGALGSASRVTVPKDEVVGDVTWVTASKLVKVGSDSLALDPNPATQAEEWFLNTNMLAERFGHARRSETMRTGGTNSLSSVRV